MKTFDEKIGQTRIPSVERALRINKCLARCLYFDSGSRSMESLSCCKICWKANQAGCMKKTSDAVAYCATLILGLGTCGIHTYFCEYRGYIRTRARVGPNPAFAAFPEFPQAVVPPNFFEWLCFPETTPQDLELLRELQNNLTMNRSSESSEDLPPAPVPISETSQSNKDLSIQGSPPPMQSMTAPRTQTATVGDS